MKPFSIEYCCEVAKQREGKCLSAEYKNAHSKLTWQCKIGHRWNATLHNIKNGNTWCPNCACNVKFTIKECCDYAKAKDGKCLSKKYINGDNKLSWKCKRGHKWEATFNNIRMGKWCPECSGNKKLTIKDCCDYAKTKNGKCLSDKYINNSTNIKWQCKKGHKWEAIFNNIKSGSWCPKCSLRKSQNTLTQIVRNIYPRYTIFVNKRDFDWLKNKNNMEIDIYVAEIKLAIEYDGQQHFEPVNFGGCGVKKAEQNLLNQKKRDELKNKLIKQNTQDIHTFVRITYATWLNKANIENIINKNINNNLQRGRRCLSVLME